MNDLQSLLKDLYVISGLNMSIFDLQENVITSYPMHKSDFCALIAKNPKGLKHCQECDHCAFLKVKDTKQIAVYQCYYHLYEAVVPLYTYGVHSGYLMMGQTLTSSPIDKEDIKKQALPYVKHQEELEQAIENISLHSMEQILSFASIVDICAKYLTLTNRIEAKNKNLAQSIKTYLNQNYQLHISINDLCDYFYCSKATLTTHFKKEYQTSIHQYLLQLRLNKALELLHERNLSIHNIALSCGFQEPNYFTKAFKKKYHMSPHEYRQTL